MPKLVAVLDSGVGGVSVLQEIATIMPKRQLLYIADSRYMPYGNKSVAFIQERCAKLISWALEQQSSAIVVACNTATACALSYLRELYPQLPIVGVEPGLKPAVCASKNGVIGVLATSRTLQSERFMGLIERYAKNTQVITCACKGLAEQIENGDLYSAKTYDLLKQYVHPLLNQGCDVLVLGCTHYPFLRPLFDKLVPSNVQIIDTGKACAKHLQLILNNDDPHQSPQDNKPITQFFSSLDAGRLAQTLPNLWNHPFSCANLPADLC